MGSVESGQLGTAAATSDSAFHGRGLVLASALIMAFALLLVTPSHSAAAQPVLRTSGAQTAWGYLENEAEALLAAQGLSADMGKTQARGLIRSYVFLRLIGDIDKPDRSPQDQTALSYLQSLVTQEQHYTAIDAGQTWNDWVTREFGCPNGDLTDWLIWEGGNAACGFWQIYGSHPQESAFTAAGYENVWSTFSGDTQAAHAVSDMVTGTSYWGGVATNLPADLTGQAQAAGDAIHEVVEEDVSTAAQELLVNLGTSLVDTVKEGAPGPDDLVPLGLAAGVIASNEIWNVFDVKDIAEGLREEEEATDPANNPPAPALSRLTQAPGITELAYLVTSQTLDGITTEALPCTVNGVSEMNRCDTYTVGSDADFEQATYGSKPAPVPDESSQESNTEPFFELTELEGANKGATCDSPTVEPPTSCGTASSSSSGAMPIWRTSLPEGNGTIGVNADLSSARGVSSNGLYDGYTSFIDNGMFVTRLVAENGSPVEDSWEYRPGISYKAPDGTRWEAYYQNGSFLQTKLAAPIAGSVYTGYQAADIGGDKCEEEPTWAPKVFEPEPTGYLCLFETTQEVRGGAVRLPLSPGDEVMMLGARTTVKEASDCWQTAFEEHRCKGNGQADVLYPGQSSQIGPAFEWQNLLSDITGLGAFEDPYTFSPQDPSAWLVTRLNTCAGRGGASCTSPSSDVSNCTKPATEDATQPWRSTTCFRDSTITYTAADGSEWQAQLMAPPAAVPHHYTALADDSAFSCCTSDRLTVPAAEGLLSGDSGTDVSTAPPSNISVRIITQPAHGTLTFNKVGGSVGSFAYLPTSGFGWAEPADDSFTYEVCNSHLPTWEKQCSEATATVTVHQAPPTVNPVTIQANIGTPAPGSSLYVAGYKYHDRQGTPEGQTHFAWFRNGKATGITTPEYPVGAGDVGNSITAVVTAAAQDGTQGTPEASNALPIIGAGPFSYSAQPVDDKLTCAPAPLYFPTNPPMSTTCTATVAVSSLTATYPKGAKATGKVTFRSTGTGAFAAPSCTLAAQSFVPGATSGTTTSSCSVSFTPASAGTTGVVGAFAYGLSPADAPGNPGGFGHTVDYQSTSVGVDQAGPGGTVRFGLTGLSNAAAGTPQTVRVVAIDGNGSPAPGYTGTIHFTSTDTKAGLPADYTFTPADEGAHTFTGVMLETAGTKPTTVTAADTALPAISGSQTVTVSVGVPSKLLLGGLKFTTEGGVTAGAAQKVSVTAEDAGGNVVTTYTGTVHFSSNDGQATLPADYTFTAADQGKHTFIGGGELALKTVSNATVGVSDGTITGSVKVTVDAAATSRLTLALADPAKPVTAGEPRAVVVTALDPYGNVTPFYTGSVTLTSSDGKATVPAPYTFTDTGGDGDFGVHEFEGLVLRAVGHGEQTLAAADPARSKVKGSISLPVQPAATAGFNVSTSASGSGAVAGTSHDVTVQAVDPYGNVTPAYQGTVEFGSTDKAASLPSEYAFQPAEAGAHKFSGGAVLKTAGTQTITATDTELGSVTGSQAVSVIPAAVAKLGLGGIVSAPPGTAQSLTVDALDAYGNVSSGYTGTIAFTSSDSAALLPPNYAFTASDQGEHRFANGATLNTLGSQTVTARDVASKTILGAESVGVGATRFAVASGTLTEGQPGAVAVRDFAAGDSISETGALPAGVNFTASRPGGGTSAGEGEGIFAGTPLSGSVGTYPVTLTVHSSNPPLEYSETFTLTVAAPGIGVSLRSSSSSLGASRVVVQLGFTPSSSVAEGGAIVATAPAGVTFSGLQSGGSLLDTVNVYDNGHIKSQESPTVSSAAGVATLTVPVHGFSVASGDHISVDIADVNNPTAAGTGTWTVATSSDATPVPVGQQSFVEPNGVAPFNAEVSPATAKASDVWYSETFVMPDELRANDYQSFSLFAVPGEAQSSITVIAPTGASFPQGCPPGFLTDATDFADSQALNCRSVGGNRVTYSVEHANVPAGDDATVFVEGDGATNPSSPGPNQISVQTSADPEPIAVPIEITRR
ncbi:MAG TPA: hypothetical protein VH061_06885 [Solirubrobacteraceae bacterium]|jgi:hypothetical protein|nr:hypothetical protein [Solirubrobacteraceae bacterium]